MKKTVLLFLANCFIFAFIILNSSYAENNTYLCITSDIKINYKDKPFLYASKDNIDTDGDGKSNYYENVQLYYPKIQLSLIFTNNYYFQDNNNDILFNNLSFKKDNKNYINTNFNLYLDVSHNGNDLILHIKNTQIKKNKDSNIYFLCSKYKYTDKIDNLRQSSPIWLSLFQ